MTRPKVVVVQRVLTHYRVPFFEQLRAALDRSGVDLLLVHGQPDGPETTRHDSGTIHWAQKVRNRYIRLGGRSLCWQPIVGLARDADLVVVEDASRLLANHVLLFVPRRTRSVAFWGHGRNRDSLRSHRVSEWIKRRVVKLPKWWFAYTSLTADYLVKAGVAPERITIVNNAVDTRELRRVRASLCSTGTAHGAVGGNRDRTCAFVGSLYAAKRLEFLIECCDLLRESCPTVSLLVIGDGPDRPLVEDLAATRPWVHVLGALHGEALARRLATAELLLNPGSVGLGVLDGFALGLPTVTTKLDSHGPEIGYVRHGVNGFIVDDSESAVAFAAAVHELLQHPERIRQLQLGCEQAVQDLSLERMVERFHAGVMACLVQANRIGAPPSCPDQHAGGGEQ